MKDPMIKVEHLSKVYKLYNSKSDRLKEAIHPGKKRYSQDFHALNDISFEVNRGETVGIIGTNGSGKSTLLKILTGIIAPSSGSYEVRGKVSALLELGAGFNMEYTGLQNIDLQGVMMGCSEEEMKSRREEIIRFADIGDYINQPVKNYSSGMFARLAFAVAIRVKPEILIVDEALSVGDVFFQNKCFRVFDEMRKAGTSILFVSHDINTVRKICNRVLWIEGGRQREYGDTNYVCNQYFNEQTRRLNEQNRALLDSLPNDSMEVAAGAKAKLVVTRLPHNADSMYSEDAEILAIYVKTPAGRNVKQLFPGETYSIEILSRFHRDLDNVIIGFVMGNRKGINYLAENTYVDSDGRRISMKKGAVLRTVFTFAMPTIRGGEYEISPAIAIGTQEQHVNLTWIHGACGVDLIRDDYEMSEIRVPTDVYNETLEDVGVEEV